MPKGQPFRGSRVRFCPRGHDTIAVGRKGGACKQCRKENYGHRFVAKCCECGADRQVREKRHAAGDILCRRCASRRGLKEMKRMGLLGLGRWKYGGASNDPATEKIYYRWRNMVRRCKDQKTYVKNNIQVCDEWLNFFTFMAWAKSSGFESDSNVHLDRINPMEGYKPSNCRWLNGRENSSRVQAVTRTDIDLILKLSADGKSADEIDAVFNGMEKTA